MTGISHILFDRKVCNNEADYLIRRSFYGSIDGLSDKITPQIVEHSEIERQFRYLKDVNPYRQDKIHAKHDLDDYIQKGLDSLLTDRE